MKLGNEYIYHGDKLAKYLSNYVGRKCRGVLDERGKYIRGRNSNMLVSFDGTLVVVLARTLRKTK